MKRVKLSKQESERRTERIVLDKFKLEDMCGTPADVSRFILENADGLNEYDELFYETEYYDCNERNDFLLLVGYKKETDEEYNKRIEDIKSAKYKENEALEKAEKTLIVQLLKKYGNK